MKYEEIKIGDVFIHYGNEETVISKSDKHRIITTIDYDMICTTWKEGELHLLEPIKEELPEEGLLVGGFGSLVYKLSDGSGYGFVYGHQSNYSFDDGWNFHFDGHWRLATPEQEKKFVEMLKKSVRVEDFLKIQRLKTMLMDVRLITLTTWEYNLFLAAHTVGIKTVKSSTKASLQRLSKKKQS